jgi:hypothetical protein
MTRAVNGTATTIVAPATTGAYKVYVIDAAGNVSNASTATLNVDATAPTNQSTVFSADVSKKGGATVTIASSGTQSDSIWLAPAGTTSFVVGNTMTKTTDGFQSSILAPAAEGSYKLFVIDAVGNVSNASTATLTVDNTAPNNQDTVFATSVAVKRAGVITIVSSGDATNSVWLAPAGTTNFSTALGTATKATNGLATTMIAPVTQGVYQLFLIDAVGNVSSASTSTVTVDTTPPNNQDTVFAIPVSKQGAAAVTIVSSGDASNSVWFAPDGTTSFVEGNTMTKAVNGVATSILAPATEGAYKLYLIDAVGNISNRSGNTLTVDNTAPINQDAVFATSVDQAPGGAVTIVSSGDSYNNVWLAPAGTTSFVAGATMTKAVNGSQPTILAPATEGDYKLFVVDLVGNVSNASSATLKVDATAPTVTHTSGAYSATTDTLVLTGTNFSTLLQTGETAATNIKARLDWTKLSWDINGDNATTADVSFTVFDINSAKVTNDTHLEIVLISQKGTNLENTAGFGGATPDTLDIAAGFAKDGLGNVATTDAAVNAPITLVVPGNASIDLGAYGTLIAPVQVEGAWYYFWDAGANDLKTHDVLDGLFKYSSAGVLNPGTGTDTTDVYRYATLNGVKVALPTLGLSGTFAAGDQPGTAVGSATAANGSNASNTTYNDMLSIWDAYNGTDLGTSVSGLPSGWGSDGQSAYWTATTSPSGHALVDLNLGRVLDLSDTLAHYVVLQVI